jgi:hypothetical protein
MRAALYLPYVAKITGVKTRRILQVEPLQLAIDENLS